jgi:hypothetical protein
MRQWAFLLVLANMALPAGAARRVSVAELEKLLTAAHGQPDKKVAKQIDDLELTERVSYARLTRWEAEFPGSQSKEALTKIADGSAFEGAAAEDVPDTPKPDREAQKQMLMKAMDYTADALHRLPNFMATRRTKTFETVPHILVGELPTVTPDGQTEQKDIASGEGVGNDFGRLFVVDSWNSSVTYRNGAEVIDGGQKRTEAIPRELTTWGEFGPILTVVLSDALQGKLLWAHWERGVQGDYGVFSYAVPQVYSRYNVDMGVPGSTVSVYPAYHGEIGIDPATGSILRISVEADFQGPEAAGKVSMIQVEYGEVEIGGSNYICPVRSVAIFRIVSIYGSRDGARQPNAITRLNDVVYTNYHLFRSEARILTVDGYSVDSGTPKHADPAQEPTQEQK